VASRIHFTGGPGSGKTYAARRVALARGVPSFHLDEMALDLGAGMPSREAFEALPSLLPGLYSREEWVSDGSYMGWAAPMLDHADAIIWMDTPGRVALYRILVRHLKAELARANRFPGWRRLWHFWHWSRRYYQERNRPVLGFYGVPETRGHLRELLQPYAAKVTVCRSYRDVVSALALSDAPARTATP
jgi:adenylate kinase family enzyme